MEYDAFFIEELGRKIRLGGFSELKELAYILAEEEIYAPEVLPNLLEHYECSSSQSDKIGESFEARSQCWFNLIYRWTCLDDHIVEISHPINYLVSYWKKWGKLIKCKEGRPPSDDIYVKIEDVRSYLRTIWAAFEIHLPLPRRLFPESLFQFPEPNILRDTLPLPWLQDQASKPVVPHENLFRKKGEYWEIIFEGRPILLKDSKGLNYIHLLLNNPNKSFSVLEMLQSVPLPNRLANFNQVNGKELGQGENLTSTKNRYDGNIIDKKAAIEYRSRITEIDEILIENDNPEFRLSLEEEKSALIQQLRENRFPQANRDIERARQSIRQAIWKAIRNIEDHDSNLGGYLSKTIKTGADCFYHPLTITRPWNF